MLTAVLYVLIIAAVGCVLFVIAALVFGRGERLAPRAKGAAPTWLPDHAVDGDDVRALRFQQAPRGYKTDEVDWALARLGAEIDRLRATLAAGDAATGRPGAPESGDAAPGAGRVRPADGDGEQ